MVEILETTEKRPCCLLLRELTEALPTLTTPEKTAEVLEIISQHCVLMKLVGKSKTKIDFSKGNCFLSVNPDEAASVITEAQKTAEVFSELAHFEELFNKINQVLANNAKLKELGENMQLFLLQLREGEKGEKRFGAVPFTDMHKDDVQHGLSAGELLKAHPKLENAAQFQGQNPKSTANPVDNPDAAKNAEQLQHQLQYQPKPGNAPKFNR